MGDRFLVTNLSRTTSPRLPRGVSFLQMKNKVLGKAYELSLVFVTPSHSRVLNRTYRKKDRPANILTFPLSRASGEIVICPFRAKKDAPAFNLSEPEFFTLLFIHGMLHLKGRSHNGTMERIERALLKKFLS